MNEITPARLTRISITGHLQRAIILGSVRLSSILRKLNEVAYQHPPIRKLTGK
jgi:hypothetical protein